MVLMDSLTDEEEFNSNDSTKSGNYASHTGESNSIILHPFAHQVGGHTQLLTFDKSTLCKPLIPRELLFYLNVPKELVNFVPSYKGVVQIRETGQGTYPPVVYQPLRSPKSPFAKYRPHHGASMLHAGYHSEDDDDSSQQSVTETCGGFPFELKVQIRPFSDEKVLKKNLSQDNLLRADYISRPNEKYLLLLENVASKYQLPCILDLKMGTRQHGDDATEEKRHRQIAKCQASTSASLGVRLCGMQVYQVDYGGFLWYDKYYGRKMDKGGLKRALHEYFRNGSQLNEDIIDDVINRLKLLSNAVEKSPSFRFYGTSLLIIHEGCANINKRCPVDVRLIDFAHTICDYTNTANGRSSSSPSVLTKSSSADQLTSTATTVTQPPPARVTTTSTTTTTGSVPRSPSTNNSKTTAGPQVTVTTNQDDIELEPDDCGGLRANFDSKSSPQKPHVVTQQRGLDGDDVQSNDTENHCPPSSMATAGAALTSASTETAPTTRATSAKSKACPDELASDTIESNNNNPHPNHPSSVNTTKPNGSIRDNIATSFKVTQPTNNNNNSTNFNYNYKQKATYQGATLETLREVDPHQQPTREQSTTSITINDSTTDVTNKQISSTPTTPPSLGARKISKTSMGPDKGLLFGLENLMRLLDDLKSETLITTC